jgi:hypothetical protein
LFLSTLTATAIAVSATRLHILDWKLAGGLAGLVGLVGVAAVVVVDGGSGSGTGNGRV